MKKIFLLLTFVLHYHMGNSQVIKFLDRYAIAAINPMCNICDSSRVRILISSAVESGTPVSYFRWWQENKVNNNWNSVDQGFFQKMLKSPLDLNQLIFGAFLYVKDSTTLKDVVY